MGTWQEGTHGSSWRLGNSEGSPGRDVWMRQGGSQRGSPPRTPPCSPSPSRGAGSGGAQHSPGSGRRKESDADLPGHEAWRGSRVGGRSQPSPEPQPHREPPLHTQGPPSDPHVSSWGGRRDTLVLAAAPKPAQQQRCCKLSPPSHPIPSLQQCRGSAIANCRCAPGPCWGGGNE